MKTYLIIWQDAYTGTVFKTEFQANSKQEALKQIHKKYTSIKIINVIEE